MSTQTDPSLDGLHNALDAVVKDPPPSVDEAWNAVMRDVLQVGKNDRTSMPGEGSFSFRGVDAVVNAVGPALRAHGVTVLPKRVLKIRAVEYESKRGGRMINKQVTVEWEVRGPDGGTFTGQSVGEAADAGDKAISKAQSVAYRVFLLQALCIPTGDRDPDSEVHERASRGERPGRMDRADEHVVEAANIARGELLEATQTYGWTGDKLCDRFRSDYDKDLLAVTDLEVIHQFRQILIEEAKKPRADLEREVVNAARAADQTEGNPIAADPPITDAQLRKLHTLLSREKLVGHEPRVAWCSEALGIPVNSTKELTTAEAKRLIDKLEALPTQEKP